MPFVNMNPRWFAFPFAGLLAACTVGPDFVRPQLPEAEWHAPLPHGGKVENLARWWERLDDPLLTQLIREAEKNSPTLDMALAKVEEARAGVDLSRAPSFPQGGITGDAVRSKAMFGSQVLMQTSVRTGFDAAWELDLFGGNRRSQESARARFGAADRNWHDARISLAAEVADDYVELRTCEGSLALLEKNRASRTATRELLELKQSSGFISAAESARSQAAQAESASALEAKKGECAHGVNRLVAVTGMARQELLQTLAARTAHIPDVRETALDNIAANALRQRPDVAAAEFNLASASADIGVARAESYPTLTLMGAVGVNHVTNRGVTTKASTWSFSPSVYIPALFEGGKRAADRDAAQARYSYAYAGYQQAVRGAVREIEDALVRLDVANQRLAQSRDALGRYRIVQQASDARRQVGMASQLEQEEAARTVLQGQDAVLQNQRESVSAWIALYKALGGGWQEDVAMVEGEK